MRFGRKTKAHHALQAAEPTMAGQLAAVDALLNATPQTFRFPKNLENDFRIESSASRRQFTIKIASIGILVYNSYLPTDYFLTSDQFIFSVLAHAMISAMIIIMLFMMKRGLISPEFGVLSCLTPMFMSISYLIATSRAEYSIFMMFTMPLIVCFGSVMLPLPFRDSMWFTSACILTSSAAVLTRPDRGTALVAFSIMLNANTAFYMLFGTYRAEVAERRAYLFNLRERLRADLLSSRLAQQQAVLEAILHTGPDAMLIFDNSGIISSFSPAAEQLFGWDAISLVNRDLSILMTTSSYIDYKHRFDRHFDSVEPQIIAKSSELVGLRKDGSVFPMMLHVGEVILGDQRQFTGIIHDLTALREAHDRSQDLRTQLAHIWSMNSLGEMAAILAHELNQPLSAITNYMRGLRTILAHEHAPDEDLLEAVDQAGTQALRAGEIIRRMRSLIARKDTDQRPESLRAMILEIDFMVRLVAREGDVAVRYDLSLEPDIVLADRIQIQQVVCNLVRNASEALRGGPHRLVEISTRPRGRNWTVCVEDNGPGIAPDMMENLFLPLATSKANGMGLGLTISRAIVDHHKGHISVKASKLGGACFGFTIPRHDEGKEF